MKKGVASHSEKMDTLLKRLSESNTAQETSSASTMLLLLMANGYDSGSPMAHVYVEEDWMRPFVDTDWQYRGLEVVRIENDRSL